MPPGKSTEEQNFTVHIPSLFNMDTLHDYKSKTGHGKGYSTGYKMFRSEKTRRLVRWDKNGDRIFIAANVQASMKVNITYRVDTVLHESGLILKCECKCKAGLGGGCKHIYCLLWYCLDLKLMRIESLNNDETSCTSKPCQWKKKSNKTPVQSVEFHDLNFVKYDPEHPNKNTKTYIDNRRKMQKHLQTLPVIEEYVTEYCDKMECVMPMVCEILRENKDNRQIRAVSGCDRNKSTNDMDTNHSSVHPNVEKSPMYCDINKENVGASCGLLTVINAQFTTLAVLSKDIRTTYEDPDTDVPKITLPQNANNANEFFACRFPEYELSPTESASIEESTKGQARSAVWFKERQKRLTASRFGEIKKRQKEIDNIFLGRLSNCAPIGHLPAVKLGIYLEPKVKAWYRTFMMQNHNVKMWDVGLIVNPLAPHLGASPDGIVQIDGDIGLIEVKCCSGRKYDNLKSACSVKAFCLTVKNNAIQLKRQHNYYYQVQGTLMITGLQWCDFVVFIVKSNELFIERIYFDYNCCKDLYQRLTDFFFDYYHPYLQSSGMHPQPVSDRSLRV